MTITKKILSITPAVGWHAVHVAKGEDGIYCKYSQRVVAWTHIQDYIGGRPFDYFSALISTGDEEGVIDGSEVGGFVRYAHDDELEEAMQEPY